MKLLAGLGNPGDEYEATPHNIGFRVLDMLVEKLGISGFQQNFNSQTCKRLINGESCVFIKPQTYMNKSGKAVAECVNFFKIPIENIVIISDDINLPPGKARFREGGGHGGHNGLRSIINSLGNNKFCRVRIGVGRPASDRDVVGHVLGRWSKIEEDFTLNVIDVVVRELIIFLETSKFEQTSFSVSQQAIVH